MAAVEAASAIKEWEVVEHFGIDWPEQAVHLELGDPDIVSSDKPLCVVDQEGRAVPAQLVRGGDRAQVWYLAALKPHERKSYRLRYGKVPVEHPLNFAIKGDVAELRSESFGIRLSWASGKAHNPPSPLGGMPGPIQEISGPDGIWFGKGCWQGEAWCRGFSCEVIEQGPVLLRVRQTYELDGGGELVFDYRLDAATSAVQVTQRCTSSAADAEAVWEFFQPGAFEPTHAFWKPHSPEAWRGPKDHRNWYRQVYALRWPATPDEAYLTTFYNWEKNGAMFWSCWPEEEARRDLLLIGAIRASKTRCPERYQPFTISCWNEDGHNCMRFSSRLQEGEKLFGIGVIDRRGALPTEGTPESRVEGLYRQLHCLGLDEYHHMSLDWEGMQTIGFPHLMIAPDEVPQIRNTFEEWTWLREQFEAHVDDRLFAAHEQDDMRIRPEVRTLGSDWAGAYLATGNSIYAYRAKLQIKERLDRWVREFAAVGPTVDQLIGITFARPWRSAAIAFDLVADSEAFTEEERLAFLRKFAFIAEVASTHDAWPRPESGLGFPNPNFHADYLTGKGISAALLTGHPRQQEWMEYAIAEAASFLRRYHHPSGCADEAATYQFVSLGYILVLATAVQHAGGDDLFAVEPVMKKSFDYLAATQTPRDPRAGFCMLPTVGHVTSWGWCQSLQTYFAWAAKATAASDPLFSRRMMAAWRRAGSPPISLHDWMNDAIWWQPLCLMDRTLPAEPDPAHHQSKLHEGFGTIFRAVHDNEEEGYLLVKMGPARGHYDSDEGSLLWYAYGRPILADFGCQYNPNIQCAWLHNRISFDRWNEEHWSCFNIIAHSSGRGVDYVCGEMVVDHLFRWEDWPIRRTDVDHRLFPDPRPIDPITWRRHVLYLHACEGVVIFDEIEGAQPTDWNLQVLAEEGRGRGREDEVASVHFAGQFGVDLDVYISRPVDPAISFSSFEHLGFDEPRLPGYWWKGVRWAAPEGATFGPMGERALTLRVRPTAEQKASTQGYLALLLARPAVHLASRVSALPDGGGFEWADQQGCWRVLAGQGDTPWSVSAGGDRRQLREIFHGPLRRQGKGG